MKNKVVLEMLTIFLLLIIVLFVGIKILPSYSTYKGTVSDPVALSEEIPISQALEEESIPDVRSMETERSAEAEEAEENENAVLDSDHELNNWIDACLREMDISKKVAQLFMITPEALAGVAYTVEYVGDITKEAFQEYPVGGIVYFSQSIQSRQQIIDMNDGFQDISREVTGLPMFISTDEEGGRVARIGDSGILEREKVGDMAQIGRTGDPVKAKETGEIIGGYMSELHFNVDLAPVADLAAVADQSAIGDRSFGSDPNLVSQMVAAEVEGLQGKGIRAVLKHFPGHGDISGDSHAGYVFNNKTKEELIIHEFQPFQAGIQAGADFVMLGHIALPVIDGETPATLSKPIIDILREELRFDGIVITDALNMGAIINHYDSAETAIKAIKAGVDILLMPNDFRAAYVGVLEAVNVGDIPESRIDESLKRILRVKYELKFLSN